MILLERNVLISLIATSSTAVVLQLVSPPNIGDLVPLFIILNSVKHLETSALLYAFIYEWLIYEYIVQAK